MQKTAAGSLMLQVGGLKGSYKEREQATNDFHNNMLALSNSSNKSLAAVGKAYAIADATMNTYRAANLAMATLPPPFGQIAAAAAIAAGIANVKSIISTNPQSSARAGTTPNLAIGSVTSPNDARVNSADIANNASSDYYDNKVQIEFVGQASRVLQAVQKEGQQAGFIV